MERMTSEAKEHVQTIVWIVEGVTFLATALIAWLVWRVARRAQNGRRQDRAE